MHRPELLTTLPAIGGEGKRENLLAVRGEASDQ